MKLILKLNHLLHPISSVDGEAPECEEPKDFDQFYYVTIVFNTPANKPNDDTNTVAKGTSPPGDTSGQQAMPRTLVILDHTCPHKVLSVHLPKVLEPPPLFRPRAPPSNFHPFFQSHPQN